MSNYVKIPEDEEDLIIENLRNKIKYMERHLESDTDAQDAKKWRALVSGIRTDISDWPKEEREGFTCTLFRYIGMLRFRNEELEKEVLSLKEMMVETVKCHNNELKSLYDIK